MKAKITVTPVQQEQTDIFTPGNLVISGDDKQTIVLIGVRSDTDEGHFCGTIVASEKFREGVYKSNWPKSFFQQFHGTITLSTTGQ